MGLFKRKEKNQANITLYGAGSELLNLSDKVMKIFGECALGVKKENEKGFQVKLMDGTILNVSILTDAKEMMAQTMGMANFFAQVPLENEQVKEACIHQIRMFTCIIGVTFEINKDENRTNFMIGVMHELANQITAFVLYPSMQLYHPDGKLLISMNGETDFEEYYPIMCKEMVVPTEEETQEDKERKARSIELLKEKGIPYIEHMGVCAYDAKSKIPQKEEILHRAIAVFAACVKSEIYTCGEYKDVNGKTKEVLGKLEELYGFTKFLSEEEKEYMKDKSPDMATHNKFGWRYECCMIFLWALKLMEMQEPTEICDASEIGGIIWQNDFDSLLAKAVLRERDELLDMQDLVYRYDWACIEARIKNMNLPMLNGEIVCEWHYALNWLAGVDGVTDWDNVPRRA